MIAEMVEVRKLGDLCEVITKGTTPTSIGHAFVEEGINFVKVESLTENGGFIKDKFAFITEEGHEALKRSQLKEHDILFSIAGALGRTACVTKSILPANTNQALAIIRLKDNVDLNHNYLIKYLVSAVIVEEIEKLKGGVAQQNLSLGQLKAIEIPIPPLPEQERIVAKLDAAFAAIDQAKANVEQNLQNAKELFQSKLNEVFSQRGDGWQNKRLIEVNRFIDYRGKTPKKTTSGIPLITAKNVKMGYLNEDPKEYIDESDYDAWMTRGIPRSGDVLFTTEAPLANVALLKTEEKIALAQRIITLCPNRSVLTGEYLTYCLQSKVVQDSILEKGTGATVTGIKSKLLKEILIPIPSLETQARIVKVLDSFIEGVNQLQTHYTQKLAELEELKKSLLERAFRGEI